MKNCKCIGELGDRCRRLDKECILNTYYLSYEWNNPIVNARVFGANYGYNAASIQLSEMEKQSGCEKAQVIIAEILKRRVFIETHQELIDRLVAGDPNAKKELAALSK